MKKVILFAVVGVMACVANASYLTWQVNSAYGNLEKVDAWDKAILYAVQDKTYTQVSSLENETGTAATGFTEEQSVDISDFETGGYSFYIELVNSSVPVLAGYNQKQTYASLSASISTTLSEVPSVTVWHGGSFNAPEPTSAMLMMLGVAGLALRRKQRKLA